jgi:hypothetical protein
MRGVQNILGAIILILLMGFTKYAVDMGTSALINVSTLKKIDAFIQMSIGVIHTHIQTHTRKESKII